MDWKQLLTEQSMKLMQDPRVQKVMQDERVVKTMMRGLQMRQQVQAQVDERVETVAESLNLTTKKELRESMRSMKKMELDLSKAQAALAEARAKAKD